MKCDGSRERFRIEGEFRRLEFVEPRLKADVADVKRIVQPASGRNDDLSIDLGVGRLRQQVRQRLL
jgi:hypothetical protein